MWVPLQLYYILFRIYQLRKFYCKFDTRFFSRRNHRMLPIWYRNSYCFFPLASCKSIFSEVRKWGMDLFSTIVIASLSMVSSEKSERQWPEVVEFVHFYKVHLFFTLTQWKSTSSNSGQSHSVLLWTVSITISSIWIKHRWIFISNVHYDTKTSSKSISSKGSKCEGDLF